jgi:Flp pilus assembly protein TadD
MVAPFHGTTTPPLYFYYLLPTTYHRPTYCSTDYFLAGASTMHCRSLILALVLLAGAAGCTTTLQTAESTSSTKLPDELKHTPETILKYGDYLAGAGFAAKSAPAQQRQYREDAKLCYLKAIEVDAKYLPAYLALARLEQACGDYAGAVAVFDRALQLDAHNAGAWFERGICLCRTKNFPAAVDDLRKACELEPANKQYNTTLGFTLARAGRYDESFTLLARDSSEAKAHSDLARMLFHLNQPELARQQALLAVNKDPSQEAARALLASLDGKPEQPGAIQTASYSQPASAGLPMTTAPANFPLAEGAPARPIRVPPPPVITIRSQTE